MTTPYYRYGVILADPPWKSQVGGGRIKRGADRHYPLMSTKELCAMAHDIPSANDSVLFMWSTWNDIPEALKVIQAWGFTYVSGLPWVKLTSNGVVAIGLGQYLRGCSEPLLFATRGHVQRLQGASPLALLMEEGTPLVTPRMEHSRKPTTAYEFAECFPGPYLEVFARSRREGWDAFGNEVDKYAAQPALSLGL